MDTSKQRCKIHTTVAMARSFETEKGTDGRLRYLQVKYHCRVCRAVEMMKKLQAGRKVPRN